MNTQAKRLKTPEGYGLLHTECGLNSDHRSGAHHNLVTSTSLEMAYLVKTNIVQQITCILSTFLVRYLVLFRVNPFFFELIKKN